MAKIYIVTGYVFREQKREILSKPFKTRKRAEEFKRDKEKELRRSIPKHRWVRTLKIRSFDTGFPESRWEL